MPNRLLLGPSKYWSGHTVHVENQNLESAEASLDYFHWRCDQYPGYLDLMPVAGFDGLDLLDYGCGPGHDIVGFATYSQPRSILGIDVSEKALEIARKRLELHGFDRRTQVGRIEGSGIELPDSSIDYIHSSGVLHHLPNLANVLNEFARVLREGGRVRLMVYNRESLWWHLYVPYVMQIRRRIIARSVPITDAFRMSTDGFDCPISEAYTLKSFAEVASASGFRTELVGSSISLTELSMWKKYSRSAVKDRRLGQEHRSFLQEVSADSSGNLSRLGAVPGINLVLELSRE
jgi:ubiquinone/menaquinone biosynthesis C-methylase UbiE